MTLRRSWTLLIASVVTAGLVLTIVASHLIALHGAEIGAYEWLRSSYGNSTRSHNAARLEWLAHDAANLRAHPAIEAIVAQQDWDAVPAALDGSWVHRSPHDMWWIRTADGIVRSSLGECRTPDVVDQIAGRARAFVECGDKPVMLVTTSAAQDDVRLYVGYVIGDHYADEVRQLSGTEVILLHRDGRTIGSTFRDRSGARIIPVLDPTTVAALGEREPYFGAPSVGVPAYDGYRLVTEPVDVGASTVDSYLFGDGLDTENHELPIDVVLTFPRSVMDQGALYSTIALAACSVLIVIVLVVAASRLVERFTRPLARLSAASTTIGTGEHELHIDAGGGGQEVEALAAAFENMARRLAALRRRDRAQAEEAVGRATELASAHAELQAAHEDLKLTQRQLVTASRRAGMAEVATNVLHNVGNVLNTMNVSAEVLRRRVHGSKLPSLERAVELLPTDPADLRGFVAEDPRAEKLPAFIHLLASTLRTEHDAVGGELDVLTRSIDHLKAVVRSQQRMASFESTTEVVRPAEVVDAALELQALAQTDPGIELVREYERVEPTPVDRHRILQILINLLANARHALRDVEGRTPRIVVRLAHTQAGFVIEVADNGVGIAPEMRDRIFQHGFTTRSDGHGFGLHGSANSAAEMGGTLTVRSDGPGQGATFTLSIPFRTKAVKSTPAAA